MSEVHALLIDDNGSNLSVLARLLAKQNIRCTQVANPKHLDALLPDLDDCHLVFLDLEMPELDGFDILAKLKANARFLTVPIIACTVHVSEMQVAHQRGFDGFIGKPLNSQRFPDQVARILRSEPVWDKG